MFSKSFKAAGLKVALVASLASHIQAAPLVGSSFGVPGENLTYDYLVVGGGQAGLAIATRLVQQDAGSVAIIEAGSFYEISNGNISQVPATDGFFAGKSPLDYQPLIDWGYDTTPQVGGLNQSLHYARGKTLGGCTARNFMVYHRGTVGSYEQWANTVDDQSYAWDNFLPFFQKSVNFTGPDMSLRSANSTPEYDAVAAAGDGNGPLSVTFPHYAQAFGTWAAQAFEQIGIPVINGFLSGKLIGQSWTAFTLNADHMTRDSSETSFLHEGLENPALIVYPSAMAKQILFDDSKKATGVRIGVGDFEYVLSARKEVVLSAGVTNSPQLLMASGVGPADTLKSLRIPVVANRPAVGQGMQDHVLFNIVYRVNAPTLTSLQYPSFAAEQAALYSKTPAAGMYTSPNTDVLAWEKIPQELRSHWSNSSQSALNAYPADWPEVEYISIPTYLGDVQNTDATGPLDGYNYATLTGVLVAPRSRGYVTITSPDTDVAPVINPNYLTEQSDVDIVVAAFKRMRQFYSTETMKNYTIGEEYYPGKNVSTDAEIETHLRGNYSTIWHGSSTCAMGRASDPKAVVDSQARVIGVEGLRIVDASAMPFLPPGHPMSSIYALAEKIACDISGNC